MMNTKSGKKGDTIPLQLISDAVGRSQAFVVMIAQALDVGVKDERITLQNALIILRYFAAKKSDQDAFWAEQNTKLKEAKSRELELAMALEIVKQQRDALTKHVEFLSNQLDRTEQRSDRLEEKLHNLTASLAHLVAERDRLLAHTSVKSKASLKYHEGRQVLYLEQPINSHFL